MCVCVQVLQDGAQGGSKAKLTSIPRHPVWNIARSWGGLGFDQARVSCFSQILGIGLSFSSCPSWTENTTRPGCGLRDEKSLPNSLQARFCTRRLPRRPKMLLKTSLPLLIDMLRGIRDLERSGVVHCDLTPKTIRLKGGRALIAGLKSAIILDDKDLRVSVCVCVCT